MSSASATRTINFITKAGTYTAIIMCPSGDLYQEWQGPASSPTAVYPDFATTKPTLNFVCASSRVAEGIVRPVAMKYYLNGTEIAFAGDTSAGSFAGLFKKITASDGGPLYHGLQITGNLAPVTGCTPAVIRMEATVAYGTQQDAIRADYTIPMFPATGTSYRVTIAAGDTSNFVIRDKGGSVVLKARAWLSGTEVTQGLSYKWEKMGPSGWAELTGKTSQTLTVADTDIDSYGEYRVTVSLSGSEIGSDIQSVMDASDPLDIDPCPDPADETIYEDTGNNDKVTYTPIVVRRGDTASAMPGARFYFVVKDAAGNCLNSLADRTTPAISYAVTRAMCVQGDGDVSIIITVAD